MRGIIALSLALVVVAPLRAQEHPPQEQRAAWNAHARQFMFAPLFDFPPVQGAAAYRFTITSQGAMRVFETDALPASLAGVWDDLPVGATTLRVDALDRRGGDVIGVAGERKFHRAAPFNGPYGNPVIPYADSAAIALKSVMSEPFVRSWKHSGEPDPTYKLYRYASKVIGSVPALAAMYATQSPRPADADEAIAIGCRAADFLIGISQPPGAPLEYFPPTYQRAKPTERENDEWTMLMSPAEAAQGYLDLYDVTRDEKHLAAARRIATTYGKLQSPAGTWPLKVNRRGEPVAPIDLIPAVVITFLDRLVNEHGAREHQPTLERAVGWMMRNPVRTFNWQAQFDDAKLRGPYENLSKHEACEFAGYLFRRANGDAKKIALAEELLRFAEDQFVVWEQPPQLPVRGENLRPENWFTPCSLEQYAMFEPISGSSAWMIMTYLRAYEATGKTHYLAKAQSLGNALTAAQHHHRGRYPTRMVRNDLAYWINSSMNTIRAMQMLAAASAE